jgi:two-component system sensor histidine kinase DesK
VLLAGFAVWGMWTAMRRSRDLVAAKEENALLMVDQERSRMARDLHDILGHSLTVIAVKAELADRLVDVSPERTRAEIADIQRLSRDALADVRRTVDGVRELSLPAEIARARAALGAAEIRADLPGSTDDVPSDLRELFAWTLREGVTNVVRHSAAKRCTVTLAADRITIADDGRGMRSAKASALSDGHGLSGLRERAADAGAQVVVETPPSGGFQLSVVAASAAAVLDEPPPAGRPTAAPSRIPSSPQPAESPR